jgi:Rrf2 family protein
MLALSRTIGYAISALARLAGPDGTWTLAKDIASAAEIPKAYLSTILNTLARAGLIKAKRGYRGGFTLAKSAEKISVLHVVEAVEGRAWRERCLLGLSQCSDERACASHAFWKIQREQIEKFLRSLTLAQVAEFENQYQAQLLRSAGVRDGKVKPRRNRTRTRKATAMHSERRK